jgi:hypothetical protein
MPETRERWIVTRLTRTFVCVEQQRREGNTWHDTEATDRIRREGSVWLLALSPVDHRYAKLTAGIQGS